MSTKCQSGLAGSGPQIPGNFRSVVIVIFSGLIEEYDKEAKKLGEFSIFLLCF